MIQAGADFIKVLSDVLGSERAATALKALESEPSVSVRLNPSKSEGVHLPILEGSLPVAWSPYGKMLSQRPVFTLHPLFHSGVYYVQDSSAMFVGHVFREILKAYAPLSKERPLRVLDLCAAPGGKTTDIAASLRESCDDQWILVSNEISPTRARVLADNVARWGDACVMVTSADPKAFCSLKDFFDIIVADVPCSGEGMFRKDSQAVEQWSMDNVNLCAQRQRRIVADVWPSLRPGGAFIYSTCTFNHFENDDNAQWIASEMGASPAPMDNTDFEGVIPTKHGFSLVPGFVPGEGQYCAALIKDGDAPAWTPSQAKDKTDKALEQLCKPLFKVPVKARRKGDLIVATPSNIDALSQEVASKATTLSSGCAVGELKGKDLVPDEDLALCTILDSTAFNEASLTKEQALSFLHKDPILLPDSPKGIVLLRYKGVPLGFVKNLGNRTNNLHPQGRRIRMDIK
ncbi:MAG: rRNA cytosine-C5-methyltransferase [Bacteroidales bacterium]|nr:rRNA cytosine-C5-methyltransferase [Bacteroidales bacterium]